MDKKKIELILKGDIAKEVLTEEEKEIALKILSNLEGTLVIRATSILEFCLKAIQYSKVTNTDPGAKAQAQLKSINELRANNGLEPIPGGDYHIISTKLSDN